MGLFDSITGAVSAGTGLFGGIIGGIQNRKNLAFQKDVFNYQKELQQTMFEREDNAMQRRAADLEAAGLSKTLAAGGSGAGAGTPIKVTAPQSNAVQNIMPGLNKMAESAQLVMSMLSQKAQIDKTKADQNLVNAQADKTRTEAEFMKSANPVKLDTMQLENMLMRRTQDYKVSILESASNKAYSDAYISQLNQTIKQQDIQKNVLDIARKQIENDTASENLTLKQKEVSIKELAIKYQQILNEEKSYNLKYYQSNNVPSNLGFDPLTRSGAILTGALNNIFNTGGR